MNLAEVACRVRFFFFSFPLEPAHPAHSNVSKAMTSALQPRKMLLLVLALRRFSKKVVWDSCSNKYFGCSIRTGCGNPVKQLLPRRFSVTFFSCFLSYLGFTPELLICECKVYATLFSVLCCLFFFFFFGSSYKS